jgi:hypothetical protein
MIGNLLFVVLITFADGDFCIRRRGSNGFPGPRVELASLGAKTSLGLSFFVNRSLRTF